MWQSSLWQFSWLSVRSGCWSILPGVMLTMMLQAQVQPLRAEDPVVFVTAFAAKNDGAIHAYKFDSAAGKLSLLKTTGGIEHPFFIAPTPDKKSLYAIHAPVFSGPEDEFIAGFEVVGRTGELKPLNRQSTKGRASCYLQVDATGKAVLVANYTSGSVASLPRAASGELAPAASFFQHAGKSVDPGRQMESHAHCIVTSPDNKFVYVADLGLDQIVCYRLDPAAGKLAPNAQPFVRTLPGAGPRHLTFHPNGKWMYVINELANSVTHFDYEANTGFLIERKTISTLPSGFKDKSYCADLKITPDGKYLYGTNRGHHSLAMYKIGANGDLELIGIEPSRGDGPQNLAIVPSGKWLLCANMPGNNVAVFAIDTETGKLKLTGTPVETKSPSCLWVLE